MFIKDLAPGQSFKVGDGTVYRAESVYNGPEWGTVVDYTIPTAPHLGHFVLTVPKLTTVVEV